MIDIGKLSKLWAKQGQITPNIENRYVLKLIHLVAQCSKNTNTVLFLKHI